MQRSFFLWVSTLALVVLGGCAHPINLGGDVSTLMGTGSGKVDRKLGLVLTEEQRAREVIGPGGGGDKLRYQPYRDLEPGLYVALSEAFVNVVKVSGATDPKVQTEGLSFIATPTLATTSYSPSMLTWPPTVFTLEISLSITNTQNKLVADVKVQGEGRAEFDEFKSNPSLSAKRAAEDALKKLIKAIAEVSAKLR
ncbi:MAG: hypothetical protein HY021_11165 [Burkholderiales bacterium]|nr:hypothetical protein [Burkholderiales bacterium]